jgi:hypothetical protein
VAFDNLHFCSVTTLLLHPSPHDDYLIVHVKTDDDDDDGGDGVF